jgi:membrane-associated phospholipid phosphatase
VFALAQPPNVLSATHHAWRGVRPGEQPPQGGGPCYRDAALRARSGIGAWLVVSAIALTARNAKADDHRLDWDDAWPKFQASEYAYTAGIWTSYAILELAAPAIERPLWTSGLPGDVAVRGALVASTRAKREAAGDWSDALWIGGQVMVWIDSVAVPLFTDDWNFEVAAQLTLLNAEAMGPTALISRFLHRTAGRERPDKHGCRQDPKYGFSCGLPDASGFPSGHTSAGFVAAGLSCAHHQHLGLYGHPAADAGMCALMLTGSTTNGILRIVADRHWVSDVVAGALLGGALGYGLPTLLHYRYDGPLTRQGPAALALRETAVPRYPLRYTIAF